MHWRYSYARTLAAKSIRKSSFLTVLVVKFFRCVRMTLSSRSWPIERIDEIVVVQGFDGNNSKSLDHLSREPRSRVNQPGNAAS